MFYAFLSYHFVYIGAIDTYVLNATWLVSYPRWRHRLWSLYVHLFI